MLVACRLAGRSALEGHYAGLPPLAPAAISTARRLLGSAVGGLEWPGGVIFAADQPDPADAAR